MRSRAELFRADVNRQAHMIYLGRGGRDATHGCALDDWLRAKGEVYRSNPWYLYLGIERDI
jgi:hypothetical protein